MSSTLRRSLVAATSMALLALTACDDRSLTAPEPTLRPGEANLDIDVTPGSMTVEVRFAGEPLSAVRLTTSSFFSYCPLQLYMDPPGDNQFNFGQFVRSLCTDANGAIGPTTITGLPIGEHTFQLRFTGPAPAQFGPAALVGSATITLSATTGVSHVFDLQSTMAVIRRTLKVNGQIPAANRYSVCASTFQSISTCLTPKSITGEIAFLDLPGERTSMLRSNANFVPITTFAYNAAAGQVLDLDPIDVPTSSLTIDLRYNGTSPSELGRSYCPFTLHIDPPANNTFNLGLAVQQLCTDANGTLGPTTVVDLPVGAHTYQVGSNGPPVSQSVPRALVGGATLSLSAGETTTQSFELSTVVGLVSGVLTIKGGVPPVNEYLLCLATFGFSSPCLRPNPTTGAFRFFDVPGARTALVRKNTNSTGNTFTYDVTAGHVTDVGTIAGDQATLALVLQFDGVPLGETGVPTNGTYCPFQLYMDPQPNNSFGRFAGSVCANNVAGGITIPSLPIGSHTFQLLFIGPPPTPNTQQAFVGAFTVSLNADQTTTQVLDLKSSMGLVSGKLTVNGQVPQTGQYFVCPMFVQRFGQPCVTSAANTGLFAFLDLPGARAGMVRSNQNSVAISDFGYTVTAGQTTLVGTTTGGSSGNTSTGASVEVKPVDSRNNSSPATLVFGNVTASGQTTLSSGGNGPTLPKGKKGGDPLIYYNIATTATFQNVTLCINYSESDFKDPSTLQLFHFENDVWVDVTGSHDPVAKVICSKPMTSLSPFVVTEADAQPPAARISVSAMEAPEGSSITFDGSSSTDDDGTISTYEWDLDNNGTYEETGETVAKTFVHSGSQTVGLKVTDNSGATSTTTATVTITNVAPTVTVGADQATFKRTVVTLAASFTDPGADDGWTYVVDWGDGTVDNDDANTLAGPGNLPALTHQYGSSLNSPYTVTVTVKDKDGGSHSKSFTVTVTNRKPTIASMGGPYSVIEGGSVTFAPTATDPDGDPITYAWAFSDGGSGIGARPSHQYVDDTGQPFTATLTVTDDESAVTVGSIQVTVQNAHPVLGAIGGLPSGPIPAGSAVTLTASFTDAGSADSHTGAVVWDIGSTPQTAAIASGTVSATRVLSAGVYTVSLSVTDDDGGSASATATSYIVVYDPSEGFVTGGGWIMSPANAYAADPTLTGRASFGFVAKYQKGANTPTGNTEFEFKAGDLRFKATSYEWLVVAGSHAKYKGEGTINGGGRYGFLLTAIDGDTESRGSADALRIKIWDATTGAVVYDNKMGELEDSDASTVLGGGSIVIHK